MTHLGIGLVTKMGLNQVTGWLGGVSQSRGFGISRSRSKAYSTLLD